MVFYLQLYMKIFSDYMLPFHRIKVWVITLYLAKGIDTQQASTWYTGIKVSLYETPCNKECTIIQHIFLLIFMPLGHALNDHLHSLNDHFLCFPLTLVLQEHRLFLVLTWGYCYISFNYERHIFFEKKKTGSGEHKGKENFSSFVYLIPAIQRWGVDMYFTGYKE